MGGMPPSMQHVPIPTMPAFLPGGLVGSPPTSLTSSSPPQYNPVDLERALYGSSAGKPFPSRRDEGRGGEGGERGEGGEGRGGEGRGQVEGGAVLPPPQDFYHAMLPWGWGPTNSGPDAP